MKNELVLLHRWAAQLEDYDFEILHRPGKNQGHVDALSRLPMDAVHFIGKEKTVLSSTEATIQVLERIHKDGHLEIKKTLKLFRRRFEGVWDASWGQTTSQERYPGEDRSTSPWMLSVSMSWYLLLQGEKGKDIFFL